MHSRWSRVVSLMVLLAMASGVAALLPGARAEAIQAGPYTLRLTCNTSSASGLSYTFTHDGTPVGQWSQPPTPTPTPSPNLACEPGQSAEVIATATADWNDLTFKYKCPKTSAEKTLTVPAPDALPGVAYALDCTLPGTPTPTPSTSPAATLRIVGGVGGIAELAPLSDSSAVETAAPAGGSGWSAGGYAALAGGLAAAAVAIAGGGWYARRRFSRS